MNLWWRVLAVVDTLLWKLHCWYILFSTLFVIVILFVHSDSVWKLAQWLTQYLIMTIDGVAWLLLYSKFDIVACIPFWWYSDCYCVQCISDIIRYSTGDIEGSEICIVQRLFDVVVTWWWRLMMEVFYSVVILSTVLVWNEKLTGVAAYCQWPINLMCEGVKSVWRNEKKVVTLLFSILTRLWRGVIS